MGGYIVSENKTFQVFLKTEDVIRKRKFSIINQYLEEEYKFIVEKIKNTISPNDKIIEMGSGVGMLMKMLENYDFNIVGFDNDIPLVNYCQKQGLNVFYADATKKLPREMKNTFKVVIINFNTLFNFPKKERKKWVQNAAYLLVRGGLLLFTVYAKNKYADRTINERLKFYNYVIGPQKNIEIKFSRRPKTCIKMVKGRKTFWFSEWLNKEDLINEIRTWTNFNINSITLMKNKFVFEVVLRKV